MTHTIHPMQALVPPAPQVVDEAHAPGPGGAFSPHDSSAPVFGGIDIIGLVAATVITLGPLAAYAVGLGA